MPAVMSAIEVGDEERAAAVLVGDAGEAPDVAEPDGRADRGEDEADLAGPFLAGLALRGGAFCTSVMALSSCAGVATLVGTRHATRRVALGASHFAGDRRLGSSIARGAHMSFGKAAARGGGRSVDDAAACPCGSGEHFGGCCAPVLRGEPAPTAERLMRSRYTAFAVGDADHLIASWHPRTRPDDVTIDPDVHWTGLRIDDIEAGGEADAEGVVEFTATWVEGAGRDAVTGALHERSRFARRAGRWWYIDGVVG